MTAMSGRRCVVVTVSEGCHAAIQAAQECAPGTCANRLPPVATLPHEPMLDAIVAFASRVCVRGGAVRAITLSPEAFARLLGEADNRIRLEALSGEVHVAVATGLLTVRRQEV